MYTQYLEITVVANPQVAIQKTYLISSFIPQMITRLKELLKRDNITVDERIFETEDGIAGLGDTPFVSINPSAHHIH